jgi:hypothetical protein
VDGTRLATTPALLRAAHGDHPNRAASIQPPRLVRRRTAIVVMAVLTPLAVVLGASAGELRARVSSTEAPRRVATPVPRPTGDVGICGFDVVNLVATIASLPGDVASDVMAHLSTDYAGAIESVAMTTVRDALPPPPDAFTLAHVLARLSGPDRRAVLTALLPQQQAAINAVLFDTALTFMTYGVRPPCP